MAIDITSSILIRYQFMDRLLDFKQFIGALEPMLFRNVVLVVISDSEALED
jgi:hypothetical protein